MTTDWTQALCAKVEDAHGDFHASEKGIVKSAEAIEVCGRCSIRRECLDWITDIEVREGPLARSLWRNDEHRPIQVSPQGRCRMRRDDMIAAIRPTAAALASAVDHENDLDVQRILTSLDTQQLYALAVVLAAHVDVPLVDGKRAHSEVDHAVVQRLLARDWALAAEATRAERRFVCDAWRELGRPMAELAQATGWQVWRYLHKRKEVA